VSAVGDGLRGAADVHNNRGVGYFDDGDAEQAIEEFGHAARLAPSVAEYHLNLAAAYASYPEQTMRLKGWAGPRLFEEMRREYRTARWLEPEDLDIAFAYADHLAAAGEFEVDRPLEEELAAWQRCLELQQGCDDGSRDFDRADRYAATLLNIGRTELRLGRPQAARAYAEYALRIQPGSRTARGLLDATLRSQRAQATPRRQERGSLGA